MKYVYDNSNLAESYSGVTTPLTYSFASHVYREVYKHFCRNMGVSESVIKRNEDGFSSLLSFIGYRMYYNLRNWYEMISYLPAYRFNRGFFSSMLGVEAVDVDAEPVSTSAYKRYLFYLPRVTVQFVRIGCSFLFMGRLVRRFNRDFDVTLAELESIDLDGLTPSEILNLYSDVSKKLLARWWVPIANDFAVMVSTGIVSNAMARWVKNPGDTLYVYSQARGNLVTLDPGKHLMSIVTSIQREPELQSLFLRSLDTNELQNLLSEHHSHSETCGLIKEYIEKFGSRVPNELKLESHSLRESPDLLLGLLQSLVRSNTQQHQFKHNSLLPSKSMANLNPVKRLLVKGLMLWTRNSILRREETRFRRALIFGYVRKLFLAVGSRLVTTGHLSETHDIFYLEENEITRLAAGSLDPGEANKLVERRKTEIEEWRVLELPRRIETDKPRDELLEMLRKETLGKHLVADGKMLKGMVASRGSGATVSGVALVLHDFSHGAHYGGKVLVTRHTDPGWTVIFPFVSALVIERGGILSHAAIVARELGIPCIIGVDGATSLITDGAQVELDMDTGEIRVMDNAKEVPEAQLSK